MGTLEKLKEVFFTDADKAERCIALIPSSELASFNIAQWLAEKIWDGYPLTCLHEAQHTIGLLVSKGSDINTYFESVVLENGRQTKYTGTLAHFIATFGHSGNARLSPDDSHGSFVQFMKEMDRLGLDFTLADSNDQSALDIATLRDEQDGNGSSVLNGYIKSRDLARKLETNLSKGQATAGTINKL